LHEPVLAGIDILELVDEDEAVAPLDLLDGGLDALQDLDGAVDEVLEIEQALVRQPEFVARFELDELAEREVVDAPEVALGELLAPLALLDLGEHVAQGAVGGHSVEAVDPELADGVADPVGRGDADGRGQPDLAAVGAQDLGAIGMEGAGLDIDDVAGGEALAQLAGGALGEGEGEDLLRGGVAVADEVGDALGDGEGFAAAGGSGDEDVRADGRGDDPALALRQLHDRGSRHAIRTQCPDTRLRTM
jgi:hypothetical protein